MKPKKYQYGLRLITLLLLLVWMAVIFGFSAQDAAESGGLSGGFAEKLLDWQNRFFHLGWSQEKLKEAAMWLDKPLRKCAHASEYAILGMLMTAHLSTFRVRKRACRIFGAELLCVLYAATDEFHQLFVEGRSGQLSDVGIDGTGAFAGVLIMTGVSVLVNRHCRKKSGSLCIDFL